MRQALDEFLVVPLAIAAGFVLLMAGIHLLDEALWSANKKPPDKLLWLSRVFGDSGALGNLLGTITTSVITVTSITFSLLLIAVGIRDLDRRGPDRPRRGGRRGRQPGRLRSAPLRPAPPRSGGIEVELCVTVGKYVAYRDPLVELRCGGPLADTGADAVAEAVIGAISLEDQRDLARDPSLGLQQLDAVVGRPPDGGRKGGCPSG